MEKILVFLEIEIFEIRPWRQIGFIEVLDINQKGFSFGN